MTSHDSGRTSGSCRQYIGRNRLSHFLWEQPEALRTAELLEWKQTRVKSNMLDAQCVANVFHRAVGIYEAELLSLKSIYCDCSEI